jgi:multidrug efflux system membrane fusion protein
LVVSITTPVVLSEMIVKPRLYLLTLAAVVMVACGHSSDGNDRAASGSAGSGGSAAAASHGAATGSGSAADRPVPVQTAAAKKQDLPIWIDGLGSVSAYMTVTVHTQLAGPLQQVLFTEGKFVKKGELLAQVDPRPYLVALHTAQGSLVRDKALKDAAQHQYERDLDMRKQNLIAQATVDTDYGQLGNYDGAVRMDQAQIESANLNLDYAAIKAPLDGITGVRQIDPGNLVQPTDASGIVILTAIDPAAVFITIPQDELPVIINALAHGDVPVEVWTRGDVGSAKLGDGKIAVLDNQINQTTATLRLKALVPNPKHLLWPNAFVKARLLVETRKDAITIPAVAVQHGPNGSFVYAVGGDSSVQMKPINVALTTGELAVVDKGLSGGEQVVTEGANQLRPGAHVSVSKPGADVASSASGQAPAAGSGGKPNRGSGSGSAAPGSAAPGSGTPDPAAAGNRPTASKATAP